MRCGFLSARRRSWQARRRALADVGELDQPRVGPAMPARASGRCILLAGRTGIGMATPPGRETPAWQSTAASGNCALARIQHLAMWRRAASSQVFGDDVVKRISWSIAEWSSGGADHSVDDRQNVADADGAVLRQLGDAADRDLVTGKGHGQPFTAGRRRAVARRRTCRSGKSGGRSPAIPHCGPSGRARRR